MKKKPLILIGVFTTIILGVYIAFLVLANVLLASSHKPIIIAMGSLFVLADFGLLFGGYFVIKRRREEIKRSFDFYVEYLISASGVGMIAFNEDGDIIWISKFIESRISKRIIGKKLISISDEFAKKYKSGLKVFRFESEGVTYETNVNFENKVIVLKDVSNEEVIMKQYSAEKLVVGELEIDNFQQFQITLPEEEIFRIQSKVIKMFDELVENYNIIYRQYVNGKYIIITNQDTLNKFVETRFGFLDQIRKVNVVDGIKLTASIGVGSGSSMQRELLELAKDGLMQAQSRGGDQIAVMNNNSKPQYFGSKSEIAKTVSRVKIKQTTEVFVKHLSSSATKRVIIYGHRYADLDAVGAALGVAAIAKTYGKDVYIQNQTFDATTTKSMGEVLTQEELDLFIKPSKANKLAQLKGTIVVITDTAELDRVENPKALAYTNADDAFIFDHHRTSNIPEGVAPTNSYIDTSASSASEIIVEMIQFVRSAVKISRPTAQMMLNGIYLDTNQFRKSSSARTFQAASYLEKSGANSLVSTETLKLSEDDSRVVNDILTRIQEVKPGFFIAAYQGEVKGDVISIAANEILRTSGRQAAFVVAKIPGKKEFKLSARGIEVNVQKIVELVGGGGHFGAAAATSVEPLNIFKDNIIQAIMSIKDVK